jgi:hypothetical protein
MNALIPEIIIHRENDAGRVCGELQASQILIEFDLLRFHIGSASQLHFFLFLQKDDVVISVKVVFLLHHFENALGLLLDLLLGGRITLRDILFKSIGD